MRMSLFQSEIIRYLELSLVLRLVVTQAPATPSWLENTHTHRSVIFLLSTKVQIEEWMRGGHLNLKHEEQAKNPLFSEPVVFVLLQLITPWGLEYFTIWRQIKKWNTFYSSLSMYITVTEFFWRYRLRKGSGFCERWQLHSIPYNGNGCVGFFMRHTVMVLYKVWINIAQMIQGFCKDKM